MDIASDVQQYDMNARDVLQGTHRSARFMRFKSWHLLQFFANLSLVCFICRNFIPSEILSSNIYIMQFICSANGIFKSWEFYRSRPSSGKKQSVHIVSFPAWHMHSHPSAGHTMIYYCKFSSTCSLWDFPEQMPPTLSSKKLNNKKIQYSNELNGK